MEQIWLLLHSVKCHRGWQKLFTIPEVEEISSHKWNSWLLFIGHWNIPPEKIIANSALAQTQIICNNLHTGFHWIHVPEWHNRQIIKPIWFWSNSQHIFLSTVALGSESFTEIYQPFDVLSSWSRTVAISFRRLLARCHYLCRAAGASCEKSTRLIYRAFKSKKVGAHLFR